MPIALFGTLYARDRHTAGHSAAVAIYARDIAAELGLSEEDRQLAYLGGLVHDIGKICLPPGLVAKPDALTLAERRVMETHSEIGERIVGNVSDYAESAKIVRHHHERWDGQGYPEGLVGDATPLPSQIIAVAEAYHWMVSDKPYPDRVTSSVARKRLAEASGSQFDGVIVAAFETILASARGDYRHASRSDFTLAEEHT